MIVLDASSWVLALVDNGARGDAVRKVLTVQTVWIGPPHLPMEVLRTLRRYEAVGLLSSDATDGFAEAVSTAHLRCPDVGESMLRYIWQSRHNLSPYDGPYVFLAVQYGVPLVTNDKRLARAASALGVEAVQPEPVVPGLT